MRPAGHGTSRRWVGSAVTASVLMAALLWTGCQRAAPVAVTTDSSDRPYDVGTSFTARELPSAFAYDVDDPGAKGSYALPAGEPFTGTYVLDCLIPGRQQFLVLALLDYRPVAFSLDGRPAAGSQVVELGKGRRPTSHPFSVHVRPGYHDFQFVAFRDPFNHSADRSLRYSLSAAAHPTNRANLLAGKGAAPRLPAVSGSTGPGELFPAVSLAETASPRSRIWTERTVRAGQGVDSYVRVWNPGSRETTFAVVLLLDYREVPLTPGGPVVASVKVPAKTRATIHAALPPLTAGEHELVALSAANPFRRQPVEISGKPDLFSASERILVRVK